MNPSGKNPTNGNIMLVLANINPKLMTINTVWVGKNTNGTVDWGPMQINDNWIKVIHRRYHYVTKKLIINDPCTNVDVGSWILYNLWTKDKSLWTAIGHYHSYKKTEGNKYRIKVYAWYKKILKYQNKYKYKNIRSKQKRIHKYKYLANND